MKKIFYISSIFALASGQAAFSQSYLDDRYANENAPTKTVYASSEEETNAYDLGLETEESYSDYDDNSYASRMRKFYNPIYAMGYWGSVYTPFYYDPFYSNPYYSWGSWYQPGFSISFGYGPYWSSCWANSWWMGYGGFLGTYSPFYSPWNNYYGYGFWDGYYAGLYNGYGNYYYNPYYSSHTVNYGPRNTRVDGRRNPISSPKGLNNMPRTSLTGSKPSRESRFNNSRLTNTNSKKQEEVSNPSESRTRKGFNIFDGNRNRNSERQNSPSRQFQAPQRQQNSSPAPSRNYSAPSRSFSSPSAPSRSFSSPRR